MPDKLRFECQVCCALGIGEAEGEFKEAIKPVCCVLGSGGLVGKQMYSAVIKWKALLLVLDGNKKSC